MLKNYFSTAVNHLVKSKLFSAINIVGLAVGLAVCILIGLYVQDEMSYDEQWDNADRIFRLNTTMDASGGAPNRLTVTSFSALPALQDYFSEEIALGAQLLSRQYVVHIGATRFNVTIPEVDRDLIEIFEFETLAGNLDTTFTDPSNIALSTELAARFFGDTDAVGRIVTIESDGARRDYLVSAIYRLPEGNTVLDLPAMTLLDENKYSYLASWLILSSTSFVQLEAGVDVERMGDSMADFVDQHADISAMMAGPGVKPSDRISLDLQNIADAYLHAPGGGGANQTALLAFSAIAALVLLLGCINFTILATAKATRRAKEVAIRKAIGAGRSQLIVQFLAESFLLVFVSMLLSLAIVELMLPVFESLVGKSLGVSYSDPGAYLSLLALLIIVGLTSGLYPAFFLSRFRPGNTLKTNRSTESQSSMSLRNALVVFQFSVSIALIVATVAIYTQVQFTLNRDPGFNEENLLVIGGLLRMDNPLSPAEVSAQKNNLRQRIANLSSMSSVSLSMHQPMQTTGLSTIAIPYTLQEASGGAERIITLGIDDGFFETYQIPLIAGRGFFEDRDQPSRLFPSRSFQPNPQLDETSQANVVINASAARRFGFASADDAIGRQVRSGDSPYTGVVETLTIIGVIADTQFFSLRMVPRPEVYVFAPAFADVLTARFRGSPQAMLAQINDIWRSWAGDAILSSRFVEQNMAGQFDRERTEARVLVSFTLLAIAVACLGLFGSATFTVERRTKEIGIRKVFGAEVREVVGLFVWQFTKPVFIASLVAWPIALWALSNWLERFPYRIDTWVLAPICLAAGGAALATGWLTVAGGTLRIASANPVESLRYE